MKQVIEICKLVGLERFVGNRDDLTYWMRCSILSQWRDLRTGLIGEHSVAVLAIRQGRQLPTQTYVLPTQSKFF